MIYKLLVSLILTFLCSWFTRYPLYAQPIIVNDQPTEISAKEQKPPPPLGPACSSGAPPGGLQIDPDNPTCCVNGYVYVDGVPAKDATVIVTASNGESDEVGTPVTQPSFTVPVELAPFDVESGESIIFTANIYTVTTSSGNLHRVEPTGAIGTIEEVVPNFVSRMNFDIQLDTGDLTIGIDEPVTITTHYTIKKSDGSEQSAEVVGSEEVPAPSFHMALYSETLEVKPGDSVTITASHNGRTKTEYFTARTGTIQIDLVFPDGESQNIETKPIATINYINPKDLYQHQTIYFEGRGAVTDSDRTIVAHRWTNSGVTLSHQATFTMTAAALPLGSQIIEYAVQDSIGVWSDVLTKQVFTRLPDKVYLPTIMR